MTAPPEPKSDSKNPPAGPPGDKSHGDKPPTMTDVRSMVVEVIDEKLKPFLDKLTAPAAPAPAGTGGAEPAVTPDAIAHMVDEAVSKVNAGNKADADAQAHAKQHADLAARAERKPVERTRRSRWLGAIWDNE